MVDQCAAQAEASLACEAEQPASAFGCTLADTPVLTDDIACAAEDDAVDACIGAQYPAPASCLAYCDLAEQMGCPASTGAPDCRIGCSYVGLLEEPCASLYLEWADCVVAQPASNLACPGPLPIDESCDAEMNAFNQCVATT
jgi:hypothetical protein